jgi:hypothetical protein
LVSIPPPPSSSDRVDELSDFDPSSIMR